MKCKTKLKSGKTRVLVTNPSSILMDDSLRLSEDIVLINQVEEISIEFPKLNLHYILC